MDTMQTPIVNELSRMSAHPGADLPSVSFADPRPGDLCAHPAEGARIASQVALPRAGVLRGGRS